MTRIMRGWMDVEGKKWLRLGGDGQFKLATRLGPAAFNRQEGIRRPLLLKFAFSDKERRTTERSDLCLLATRWK